MTPIERVEKVLSMPPHRKPPVPDRLSTLESIVAELAITVRQISDILNKTPDKPQ